MVEPRYPAAVDRYLDLGRFYDLAAAKAARDQIVRHSKAGSEAYRRAYRAMAAARQISDSAAAVMAESLDSAKLLRRTGGIISRELKGRGSGGGDRRRFLGSLTCEGPVWRFDSVTALCPRVYQLQDSFGFAAPMLERIRAAAAAKGYRAILCPDPEHPDRLHHLLLPELELAFVTSREGMAYTGPAYRRVRLDAMIAPAHAKRCKARLRFLRRMEEALREEALTALQEAKAAHDRLEAVYRPNVDFAGVDQVTEQEIGRLESRL